MKKKVGIIASAIATSAVCASMIVGSTFALFTSNDSVNIAVTSGKVNVTASITEGASVSTLGGEALGSVSVEGKNVNLNNIAPGDKFEFSVGAANSSTVSVKYRVKLECTGGYFLMSAFNVTLGGQTVKGPKVMTTGWAEFEGDDLQVPLIIELPEDANNLYADLNTKMAVTLEAVQGNAVAASEAEIELLNCPIYEVATADEFVAAIAEENACVIMTNDIHVKEGILLEKSATIMGNGYSIYSTASRGIRITANDVELMMKNVNVLRENNANLERAVQIDVNMTGATVTIDGCELEATYYAVNICNGASVELVIKNSEITGWSAINAWSARYTIVVEDSILRGINDKSYSAEGWNGFGVVVIEGDTTGKTDNHAAEIDIALTRCTIIAESKTGNIQKAILFNSNSKSNNVVLTDCTIELENEDCVDFVDNGTDNKLVIINDGVRTEVVPFAQD